MKAHSNRPAIPGRRRFSLGLPLLAAGAAYLQSFPAAQAAPGDKAPIVTHYRTRTIDGIKKATLKLGSKGDAKLIVKTVKLSLANAEDTEHFIHSTVAAGAFAAEHVRLWQPKGSGIKPEN